MGDYISHQSLDNQNHNFQELAALEVIRIVREINHYEPYWQSTPPTAKHGYCRCQLLYLIFKQNKSEDKRALKMLDWLML